jgi:hypothetical protein
LLLNDEEGQTVGLSYFTERGFRPETIEKFKLGFAKDSWDHLTNVAKAGGYNIDLLKLGGLIKDNVHDISFLKNVESMSSKKMLLSDRACISRLLQYSLFQDYSVT